MTESKPTTSTDESPKVAAAEKSAAEPIKVEAAPKASVLAAPRRFAERLMRSDSRLVAVAGSALAVGAMLGFGAASRDQGSAAAVASLATAVDAGRNDTAKLAATLARLDQSVGEVRSVAEAARKDGSAKASLNEKIAQLDKSLSAKIASLGEKLEQAEKEHAARIAALLPRPVAKVEKADPAQTGSLAEPKAAETKAVEAKVTEPKPAEAAKPSEPAKAATAKPGVLEQFALRDVYDGAAIIENRSRRLFQVMPGDTLPGAGRVEAIERQGRHWVVLTRQGVVMPQEW